MEELNLTGDQGTFFFFFIVQPVLRGTLACSADDVVDDLSGDWLRAEITDRSALVQQAVKFLGSFHHCLLGITCC